MNLTWEKVSPFLNTQEQARKTAIEPLMAVLQLHLTARYGDRITEALEPAFVEASARALARRTDPQRAGREGIESQSVAGAAVRYDPRVPLTAWLWPGELAALDSLVGMGGIRSIRMSAPDGQRFGNRAASLLDDADGLVL